MYQRAISALRQLLSDRRTPDGRPSTRSAAARSALASSAPQGPLDIGNARLLINALPDPVFILDRSGTLLAANAKAQETFGRVSIGQHVGRTARNPEISAAIAATAASGATSTFDFALSTSSEKRLDGTVASLAGADSYENAPALIMVFHDISERDALGRMRMEFVANASHELRTPLTAITGFIETLRGPARDDPAAQARFLEVMSEQAQRMSRLVDDLLLLSRVEMRAHLAPDAQADLNHVATEVLQLVTPAAVAEGAVLRLELTEDNVELRGDHDELLQAVANLVQNAIKYGRPGGRVIVRTAREKDRRGAVVVRLSVVDDGPGISPEHLPRLTERFYRVNMGAGKEKRGTGLGLAIAKHIAVRHRGRIDVQSVLGQGSTFSLIFPVPTAAG